MNGEKVIGNMEKEGDGLNNLTNNNLGLLELKIILHQ